MAIKIMSTECIKIPRPEILMRLYYSAIKYLEKLEGRHRHDFSNPGRLVILVDVDLAEGHAGRFVAQLSKEWPYPSARRAPLGGEVQSTFFSSQTVRKQTKDKPRDVLPNVRFSTQSGVSYSYSHHSRLLSRASLGTVTHLWKFVELSIL